MTDAERAELEMLEGRLMRRALTEFEEERLCALRERQRESRCFRAIYDECVPYDPGLFDRIRHVVMLPPPANWGDEEEAE